MGHSMSLNVPMTPAKPDVRAQINTGAFLIGAFLGSVAAVIVIDFAILGGALVWLLRHSV
jgi:hypothetical protein